MKSELKKIYVKTNLPLPARVGRVHNGRLHPVSDGAQLGGDGFLLEVSYRSPGLDTILNAEHLSFQLKASQVLLRLQ